MNIIYFILLIFIFINFFCLNFYYHSIENLTPNIERSWLTDEEISENNKKILENKFYNLENEIDKK